MAARSPRRSEVMLELLASLKQPDGATVWHVAWSSSGATLASCAADKKIRLWGLEGSQWVCRAVLEDGHQRTIRWCSWSPCGGLLASCSFDGLAMVWRCDDGEFDCIASLEGHENEVKAVEWSASGQYIATCGRDKSVFVWEAEDDAFDVAAVLHSHTQDVKSVAWHPTEDVLASASYDDTVKLYAQDGDDWRCTSTLVAHTSTVWCVSFSADGRRLVSCSDDRSVVLWQDDGEGYKRVAAAAEVHERPIYAVEWEQPSRIEGATEVDPLIATGGGDDAVCLLRPVVKDGATDLQVMKRQKKAHDGDVNTVAWRNRTPDALELLASAGDDGQIKLWRYNRSSTLS